MNVDVTQVEAETILESLSRPADEPVSPFRAAVRARVKRKMRLILDSPEDQDPAAPVLPGVRRRRIQERTGDTSDLKDLIGRIQWVRPTYNGADSCSGCGAMRHHGCLDDCEVAAVTGDHGGEGGES